MFLKTSLVFHSCCNDCAEIRFLAALHGPGGLQSATGAQPFSLPFSDHATAHPPAQGHSYRAYICSVPVPSEA